MTAQQVETKQCLALTDTIGKPLYAGDKVFSLFHQDWITLEGIWTDPVDNEVFLICEHGTVRSASVIKISEATVNAIRDNKD